MSKLAKAMGACLLAAALLACANTSIYRPSPSEGSAGYREEEMPNGHYLISFTGTLNMEVDKVRQYMRRRAAEITVREGYTHFAVLTARSEADIRVVPNGGYWNPENGFLAGYINKDNSRERNREAGAPAKPWVGDSGRRTRYTAFAEILILRGDEAAKDPDAFAAMDVLNETAALAR